MLTYMYPIPDRDVEDHIEAFRFIERLLEDSVQRILVHGVNPQTGSLTIRSKQAEFRYKELLGELAGLVSELGRSLDDDAELAINEFILRACGRCEESLSFEASYKYDPPTSKKKGIERSLNLGDCEVAQHTLDLLEEAGYKCSEDDDDEDDDYSFLDD